MTGRDLIVYILSNGLEDEPIINNGKLIGYMTIGEAAVKLNIGFATIFTLLSQNRIDATQMGSEWFVTIDSVQSLLDKQ